MASEQVPAAEAANDDTFQGAIGIGESFSSLVRGKEECWAAKVKQRGEG